MDLLLFPAIALATGGVLYRVLPGTIRTYVALDSSLGQLLAFILGAVVLVTILWAAWAMFR